MPLSINSLPIELLYLFDPLHWKKGCLRVPNQLTLSPLNYYTCLLTGSLEGGVPLSINSLPIELLHLFDPLHWKKGCLRVPNQLTLSPLNYYTCLTPLEGGVLQGFVPAPHLTHYPLTYELTLYLQGLWKEGYPRGLCRHRGRGY